MSVIGRLDSQVEEVIIAPIARRHDERNKARERDAQPAPPEQAPQEEKEEQHSDADQG